MGNIDISFDATWGPLCSPQLVPRCIEVPGIGSQTPRPHPVPQASRKTRDAFHCSKTKTVSAGRPSMSKGLIIPVSKRALRLCRHTTIDLPPIPLYHSEERRLADLHSYHSTIDIVYPDQCASSFPPTPPNSNSDVDSHGSQADSDSSGASLRIKSCSTTLSPATITPAIAAAATASATTVSPSARDYGADAYAQLSAIYSFAPLPPPAPCAPKAAPPAKFPPPMEGGVMMAACCIQAALCTKTVKLVWGRPVETNPEDDNKPIPGWTDGSNAWRASTYGFAPPYDFTRVDPDDTAIRAYGSYVATPHRSRGVCATLDGEKSSNSSQSLSTPPIDAATQKLYQQFCASIAQRYCARQQASIHHCVAGLSTLRTSSTHTYLVRKVSLLKTGAEGHIIVPDVKMYRTTCHVFGIVRGDGTSPTHDDTCSVPPISTPIPARFPQSYASEAFLYPIMRTSPKKEKRVQCRLVDGVKCEVEVEVEVEEPIKRLFLFGGAHDVW